MDTGSETGERGASTVLFLSWGKAILRAAILTIVVWGIWRTGVKAERDFRHQQSELGRELLELRREIMSLPPSTSEADRREREDHLELLTEQQIAWSRIDPGWLLIAGLFYLTGTVPAWWFWHRTLVALGQHPQPVASARAYMIGHLGKYVPGKAMVVVLRATLVRGSRVELWAAVASVFVETLTMMAVGGAVAAVLLPVAFGGLRQPTWILAAASLAIVAGVPTIPSLFRRIVRALMRRRAERDLDSALAGIDRRHMASGWIAMVIGWIFLGLSLWATVRSLPGDSRAITASLGDLPLLTSCAALAMVLGFVSLVPGGLGVRELVVTSLLAPQPHFGAARALVAAVLLRVVWLVSELSLAGILYWFRAESGESTK